jgi:D-glycero-D-manno-heptose 1,7-bisphosphate phosphatase
MPATTSWGEGVSTGAGRKAVFLDRDGTLIHDRHYLGDPEGVELLPSAASAVARLNRAGIPVILVTNQSGIGRGIFTEADFEAVQRRIEQHLAEHGARLDAVYHCPHAPDHRPPCDCRKPAPGMFMRAARDHGLDLARSVFIGDRVRDIAPAGALGAPAFLVRTTDTAHETPPQYARVVDDLETAVSLVLAERDAD